MVTFCVENSEAMLAKLKPYLDMPFKTWLLMQLDPQQESDHATILAETFSQSKSHLILDFFLKISSRLM